MQLIRSELQADSSLTLQVRFDFTRKLIEPYAHAHAHARLLATPLPVYGPDYAVGILLQSNEVAGASSICYSEGKPEDVEAIHPTASSGYFNSHISEQQDRTNGTA